MAEELKLWVMCRDCNELLNWSLDRTNNSAGDEEIVLVVSPHDCG